MNATTKWTTVCTIGFSGGVSSLNENPAAHGSVTICQVRRGSSGLIGRKVNSNGRHKEIGRAFPITADEVAHWEAMESQAR